jgi:predicted DNA-binding protein
MSPRTGRPPLSDDVKKNGRFELRLTNEENQLLDELSNKLGISKAEVIIKAIRLLAEQ